MGMDYLSYYQHDLSLVKKITAVNVITERTVKLIEEFKNDLTPDENQKQYLL